MALETDRKKLLEKYSDFSIPPLKSNTQIMECIGLYFELHPISLTTKAVESFLTYFKKNLLFFIYQNDFSQYSTINEILNLEKELNKKEITNVDINCFRLLPNQQSSVSFGNLYANLPEKAYLLDATQYNYLESDNNLLNTILLQQRGLNPNEVIEKSDSYFAYLDILRRLDELGVLGSIRF